jgi:hypothetical protein
LTKVLDFGIAKLAESDIKLTQVGIALGSPHFMSPEQAQGLPIDARSDIYAVGILMYYLLSGKYPFDAPSAGAILASHLTQPVPSLSQAMGERPLPPGVDELVRRCLAKLPEDRFSDMGQLKAILSSFRGSGMESGMFRSGMGGATGAEAAVYRNSRTSSQMHVMEGTLNSANHPVTQPGASPVLLVGGVMIALLGAALIGWSALRGGERPQTAPVAVSSPSRTAPEPAVAAPEEAPTPPVADDVPVVDASIEEPAQAGPARSAPARARAQRANSSGGSTAAQPAPSSLPATPEGAPVWPPPAPTPAAEPAQAPALERRTEIRDPWAQ